MSLSKSATPKLDQAEREYDTLVRAVSEPGVGSRPEELRRIARTMGELEPLVEAYRSLRKLRREQDELEATRQNGDPDLVELAREELAALAVKEQAIERRLMDLLEERDRDPQDSHGTILEIRAGTGGEEAALFAADMLRMYLRFAERRGWKAEIISRSDAEMGGVKEVILSIDGKDVWRWLKHEGGVHRVQRVPATEAQGRIHTSAVSVAALPQAEEVDVEINPNDLRIDTFCSSGAGGQSVNTTYSAVRIVHVPTGIVVQCQDERSQHKNRERALKVLRARVADARIAAADAERGAARREQVRTGDRSEKIRTYNFPQNRVTDHRAGVTLHRLGDVLNGDLDELVEALAHARAEGRMTGADGRSGDA